MSNDKLFDKYNAATKALLHEYRSQNFIQINPEEFAKRFNISKKFVFECSQHNLIEYKPFKDMVFLARALVSFDAVQPVKVREIMKTCSIVAYREDKEENREKPLIELIDELNKRVKDLGPNVIKTAWRDRNNHSITFVTIQEAIDKKISNMGDFESFKLTVSPKEELIKDISGSKTISSKDIKIAEEFINTLRTLDEAASHTKFQNDIAKVSYKMKQAKSEADKNKLIKEKCAVYIKHNKVPGGKFKHIDVYNEMVKKK